MAATVVTITSGKGGVGKTTTTANLGAALAAGGKRVLCIDGDIGLRNLDVILGLENQVVYDLVDVVEGRCQLNQVIIKDPRLAELYLIPAAQSRNKTAVAPSDMVRLCDELRPEFDWILIDSSAGIERGFRFALAPADRVLIVTNPEMPAVRDAGRVAALIEAEAKGPAGLILNRVRPDRGKRPDVLDTHDVLSLLSLDLIGLVPEDERIILSSNRGRPVTMNGSSRAGEAFRNIARRLEGEAVPWMTFAGPNGLNGLKSLFRRGRKLSAENAEGRLKAVLVHDRADISPAILEVMKAEIIAAVSKQVDIQREAVELRLSRHSEQSRLTVTIPLQTAKSRRKGKK